MKISIVIATWNASAHLAKCLESCLRQTWADKEIIVIDGGSTDGTVDILQLCGHRLAHWSSAPDCGIYDAWNKALPHVTGDWILFRGADDVFWDDDVLTRAVPALMAASPSQQICYGAVVVEQAGLLRRIIGTPWEQARKGFRRGMPIPHTGTFHHRDLFRRFGKFDASYRVSGDYEFLLRTLRGGDIEGLFIPGLIVTTMSDGGNAASRAFRGELENLAARRRYGLPISSAALCRRMAMLLRSAAQKRALPLLLGHERAAELYRRRRASLSHRLEQKLPAFLSRVSR